MPIPFGSVLGLVALALEQWLVYWHTPVKFEVPSAVEAENDCERLALEENERIVDAKVYDRVQVQDIERLIGAIGHQIRLLVVFSCVGTAAAIAITAAFLALVYKCLSFCTRGSLREHGSEYIDSRQPHRLPPQPKRSAAGGAGSSRMVASGITILGGAAVRRSSVHLPIMPSIGGDGSSE